MIENEYALKDLITKDVFEFYDHISNFKPKTKKHSSDMDHETFSKLIE